jgi:RNA polymerase sigma-70 factor (ECF subfamily)
VSTLQALLTDERSAERLPGEALIFEQVFQEHAPFVWRAVRRLGVPRADVEDVCQEVFVIVHRRLVTFEGRSSLRTWIYGICVRTVAEHRRRMRRRPQEVSDAPEPSVPPSQIEQIQRRQAVALLDAILDEIDDDKRAVLVLYEIEGMPMNDVAEAVGCPAQTAYARLYAARRQFDAAVRRATLAGRTP